MSVQGPYPEVRALERGLELIQTLAERGWSSPLALAEQTGIDRTTIYRLLATLVRCGYVTRREGDGRFVLSGKIVELASGVREDDYQSVAVSSILADLVKQILWPSDFAVLSGGRLTIMASSHHLTSMTFFRALVGKERPIFASALGRAVLAAMDGEQLELTLMAVRELGREQEKGWASPARIEEAIRETQRVGYAAAVGTFDPTVSAIALPVCGSGFVIGAVNIVFFRSAMSPAEAAQRYLPQLKAAIGRIEACFRLEASRACGTEAAGDPVKTVTRSG